MLLLVLTGCGENGDSASTTSLVPVLTVTDALSGSHDGPAHVQGFLITVPDGTVYLSETIAESFPPQPGGDRIVVVGLSLEGVEDLQTEQGISWVDKLVEIAGMLENGILTAE